MRNLESRRVAIKVTGSLFDELTSDGVRKVSLLASVIKDFVDQGGGPVGIVVGGGAISRAYVEALRALNANEVAQDEVGLLATRLNAAVMVAALRGVAFPKILTSVEEFRVLSKSEKVLVGGGLHPGFSTVACAALVAEAINAGLLLILSKSGGVYDKDPALHPGARLLKEVTAEELLQIVTKGGRQRAGYYPLLDLTSISIILRSEIPTLVIPPDADTLNKALRGEEVGSKIVV